MAYTSEIEKLERRNTENPQGRLFAPLADAYRKQGEVYRAVGVLREGLERHPEYIGAYIVLGRCHLDLSQDAEAASAFTRVLALDQENVIALKVLAEIAERAGNRADAIARLEYLIQIDRGNEEAQAQLDRLRAGPAESVAAPARTLDEPPAPVELLSGTAGEAPASGAAVEEPGWSDEAAPEPIEGLQPASSFVSGPVPAVPDVPEIVLAADLADRPPQLVEESPPLPVDVAPIEGLEPVEAIDLGSADAVVPVDDFNLEREHDIDLAASTENEFQVRSDAERLGEGFVPQAGVNPWQDIAAEATALPPVQAESESPSAARWAGESREAAGADAPAAPGRPGEPGEPGGAEPDTKSARFSAPPAPEPSAEPDLVVLEDDEPVDDAPAAGDEPDLVVTETMAAVYERQGLRAEALLVYRELSARRPGDARLRDKVAELAAAVGKPAEPPAPSPSAARPAKRRGYSTAETGGRPVGAFLRGILEARLEATARPAPESAPRPELEDVGLEAAPTRPAADPVSLSAVFGDDLPPAVPAASHAAAGGAASGGFSFDAFFGSQAGAQREAAGPRPSAEDDLEQFHAWLQGLKK